MLAKAACSLLTAAMTAVGPDCVKTPFLQGNPKSGSADGHGITHRACERAEVFEVCSLVFL